MFATHHGHRVIHVSPAHTCLLHRSRAVNGTLRNIHRGQTTNQTRTARAWMIGEHTRVFAMFVGAPARVLVSACTRADACWNSSRACIYVHACIKCVCVAADACVGFFLLYKRVPPVAWLCGFRWPYRVHQMVDGQPVFGFFFRGYFAVKRLGIYRCTLVISVIFLRLRTPPTPLYRPHPTPSKVVLILTYQ